MTQPDVDTIDTYGGALNDYSPVIDETTDRGASGANPAYANVAMISHTNTRFACRFNPTGGAPVLAASGAQWDAVWANATTTAPTLAHVSTGVYTVTPPATVSDEIPSGSPGYNSSNHSVNFRFGWPNIEWGSTTPYVASVTVNANVITVTIRNLSGSLVDPNDGTIVGVFAI